MRFKWILAAFLATGLSAFAENAPREGGSWSSGGGSAVACFMDRAVATQVQAQRGMVTNDQLAFIDSIEVLDLFEWKRPRGIDGRKNLALAEPRPGEDYISFASRIADRAYATLAIHSSDRQSSLGNVMWSMSNDLKRDDSYGRDSDRFIWTGTSLVNLQDEGTPMRFGGNCALVPMAVQQGEKYELRIFIDDRLFFHPKHSVQSQAALFVHEFVYSFARELGHPNSSATRRAVGLLMQNDPSTRVQDVLARVENIGFISTFEGLRLIHPYGRMKLVSGLAYSSLSALGEAEAIWGGRAFRASPGGREERALLAEASAFLGEKGVKWDQTYDFNANRAVAYLRAYPEKAELAAELEAIVRGKTQAIAEVLRGKAERTKAFALEYVPGLSESDRAEIAKVMASVFVNRVVPLTASTLTDEDLSRLRGQKLDSWAYPYPCFTFDELIREGARDGNYSDSFYWLSDAIAREFSNYKGFDLYEYKMPQL